MLKFVLALSFILLSYCGEGNFTRENKPPENSRGELEVIKIVENEEGQSVVEYDNNQNYNNNERRRLRNNDRIIFSTVPDRYGNSRSDYGDYDPDDRCEDYESCREICDKTTRNERICYRHPRELVEDIQIGLFDIINISDAERVNASPALLKGIINIDKDLLLKVIKEEMSEGDIKSFLTWIAINKSIAAVLEDEDRRGEILKVAFKELGRAHSRSRRDERTGLSAGLIGRDDTFLALAADEYNEYAFKIGYEILRDECNNKLNCTMDLLCARERRRSSRSNLDIGSCRTPDNPRQRARREKVCYVHGGGVWSFLYDLLIEEEIRDRNFNVDEDNDDDDDEGPIGIEQCNDHCGDRDDDNCPVII